jgi:hypothetical protein
MRLKRLTLKYAATNMLVARKDKPPTVAPRGKSLLVGGRFAIEARSIRSGEPRPRGIAESPLPVFSARPIAAKHRSTLARHPIKPNHGDIQ